MFRLGIVGQLSKDLFEFLFQVQKKLNKVIKSVGKIDHALYPFVLILRIVFALVKTVRLRYRYDTIIFLEITVTIPYDIVTIRLR